MDSVVRNTTRREVDLFVKCQHLEGQLKRLQQKYDEAHGLLCEAHEFLDSYVDVRDGDEGRQEPNKAMSLQMAIDEHLNGRPY